MLSFDVAVVPPALPRQRLRCLLSLSSWELLCLLCAGSWALRCLVLCRSRSLLGSVRRPSWLPRCFLLWCSWGSTDAYTWARGRSSALCTTARGRFAAYRSAFPVAPLLRAVVPSVALLPPALLFVGLPFCLCLSSWVLRCPWALRRLLSRRSCSLRCPVCCLSWWPCCLLLRRLWGSVVAFAWAHGRLSAHRATARATACRYAAFVCSRAACAVLRGCCATSCTVCLGAPMMLTPELVGARVPLVRHPVAILLPITPPLLLAHLLCALSI